MADPYSVLAPFYERLGLADFGAQVAPRIFDFALRNGWMGRRAADLGCGAGHSSSWLIKHGYLLTCVDQSAAMLARAQDVLANQGFSASQQDIRILNGLNDLDLAFAFGVFNELEAIKDLEQVFQSIYRILRPEKWLIFDMLTIEGLFKRHENHATLLLEDADVNIFAISQVDYDRQAQSLRYIVYQRQGQNWVRQETTRTLRAYPLAAVTALLQRVGFQVLHVLKPNLERFDSAVGGAHAVVIAQKR
ncbi:MAG: class I SAM-dependent methyltransferase [Anaerolineae bacterium]|nr:class I SAM-dependent methyltransferase [Anaerolineae bacterium]MDW8171484.1 class I SAM-dependent methyltransferase [Anaerolineae bacterium]